MTRVRRNTSIWELVKPKRKCQHCRKVIPNSRYICPHCKKVQANQG